ncbi:MAG TPA: SufD family Fe-S cluster assembly protein [Erysipelotrichaceae bacterium]|nr:SufD family Fe-S cluster assembly protein [Erysipelotrichaceae bacterium]
MERISLNNVSNLITDGDYIVDGLKLLNKKINIELEVNSLCDIFVDNLANIEEINIVISDDSSLTLSLLGEEKTLKNKINITIKKNGELSGYFADFSENNSDFNCLINLADEFATGSFKVASLAALSDYKKIDISLVHTKPKTHGKVECYGVCKDTASLVFSGTSHILKGSIESKTQQTAKIMVFDKDNKAIAKPILKIDENEVEANHAAVVGKINDEHLFYLTSRGLSETEAKELITLGYLKPILLGFKEEETKNHISSLIEGRM